MRDKKEFATSLLIFGTILIAYVNSFWGPFQFDDYAVIVENPSVHSFSAWMADRGIRPVLKLSYLLNWASGLGSVGFHLLNVAIHATNTLFVYLLGRRLVGSWRAPDSLGVPTHSAVLAALLFGLHPVQTEAVTYISGRSTSLMALFYLASLLSYLRGKENGSAIHLYLLSPLLFALALLTKEVAVTLPFALLLLDFVMVRKLQPRLSLLARQSLHWILLAAALIGFAVHPGYARLMAVSLETRSLSANLASQANGVVYLLSQMFWPSQLNIDPDLPPVGDWSAGPIGNAIFLATLAAVGLFFLRRRSWLGLAICWFFLHLAPTNSFIPRLCAFRPS